MYFLKINFHIKLKTNKYKPPDTASKLCSLPPQKNKICTIFKDFTILFVIMPFGCKSWINFSRNGTLC